MIPVFGGNNNSSKITTPLSVVNSDSRITINSNNPVVIMQGEVKVLEACKLKISGTIASTFYYVSGIAIYIDDTPISLGTGTNLCHVDCMNVHYGNGNNGWLMHLPYLTSTNLLGVGTHTIKVGVICKWRGSKNTMYVNNRSSNDMASSSNLMVEAL